MATTTFHLFYTVIMFVIFIGICLWAWSRRTQSRFHEASMLPFAEDDDKAMKSGHAGKEDNNE